MAAMFCVIALVAAISKVEAHVAKPSHNQACIGVGDAGGCDAVDCDAVRCRVLRARERVCSVGCAGGDPRGNRLRADLAGAPSQAPLVT